MCDCIEIMNEKPSKYQYQWRVSFDGGEIYGEPHNSKEDAAAEARERGGGLIAECLQCDFDLSTSGYSIIDLLCDQNEDHMNEDGEFLDPSEEQMRDLGEMVSAAIAAWAEKHKIDVKAFMFADTRKNEEYIGNG